MTQYCDHHCFTLVPSSCRDENWFWCYLIGILQVEKIHSNNSIPSYLIQEGREVIRLRSTLQGLMERCNHISSELETFISDLASQKSVDSLDTSRSYVLKQPGLLTSRLPAYFRFSNIVCLKVIACILA